MRWSARRGGQQERRRRATPRAGGPAAGLPGGRLCVVTLCATCRERELLAAAGRRQSRVRGSVAFLRALLLLRSACLWQPRSSPGWTAPGGSARPAAAGRQPSPPRPSPVFPRAPRRQTPVTVSHATVRAFARGRASHHLRPGVITGPNYPLPAAQGLPGSVPLD